MKKTLAIILCALVLAASGCSAGTSSSGDVADLQAQIQELQKQNEELKGQIASASAAPDSSAVSSDAATSGETITMGTTYTIDGLCEFTVDYAQLKKEVLPPNPDSFYTYYAEEDGSTYLDVAISIKNTRTTAREASEFGQVKVVCGDGYEYASFSTIEESGGTNFTYTNITNVDPLETAVIHYIASIPNEIAEDTSSPFTLEINILGNDYVMKVQ